MLDVNIHKTNKVVLALKRKKAKARINAKKINNTALPCLRETWEWNTFDLTYQGQFLTSDSQIRTSCSQHMMTLCPFLCSNEIISKHAKSVVF